jgi:hypothetical protein
MPRLPLELIYNTIELLEDDKKFLNTSSLTSRSLRRPSQRCLFKQLAIQNWEHCLRLTEFLGECPHIQGYVSKLRIGGDVVADLVDEANEIRAVEEERDSGDASRHEDASEAVPDTVSGEETNTEAVLSLSISDAVCGLCSKLSNVKTLVIEHALLLTWYTSPGVFEVLKHQITRLDLQECTVVDNDNMLSFISLFQNLEILNIYGSRISIFYEEELLPSCPERVIMPQSLKSVSVSWTRFALTLALWLLESTPPLRTLDVYAGTPFFEVPRAPDIIFQLFETFGPNLQHVTVDSRGYNKLEDLEGQFTASEFNFSD